MQWKYNGNATEIQWKCKRYAIKMQRKSNRNTVEKQYIMQWKCSWGHGRIGYHTQYREMLRFGLPSSSLNLGPINSSDLRPFSGVTGGQFFFQPLSIHIQHRVSAFQRMLAGIANCGGRARPDIPGIPITAPRVLFHS